jgi:hypothetical protein
VDTLCLLEDDIRDPVLGRCLIETFRGLSFPAPDPSGFVDVHLPLRLSPAGFAPQRPICR